MQAASTGVPAALTNIPEQGWRHTWGGQAWSIQAENSPWNAASLNLNLPSTERQGCSYKGYVSDFQCFPTRKDV